MSNARNTARILANDSGVINSSSLPEIPATRITGTVDYARMPAGAVLQIKSNLYLSNNTLSINSSDWFAIPDMSVSITPRKNNSKFRIDVRWSGEVPGAWDVVFAIRRNITIIGLPNQEGTRHGSVGMPLQTYIDDDNNSTLEYSCFSIVDEPNTSSNLTYTLVARAWDTRTIYTGRTVNSVNDISYESVSNEIIVTEISA